MRFYDGRAKRMRRYLMAAIILASSVLAVSRPAMANWTLNLGYQNPAGSSYGVNFLYFGQQWGFEIGIGWMELKAKDSDDANNGTNNNDKKDNASLKVAGDIDVKYFFSGRSLRPYAQLGFGYGAGAAVGEDAGAGVATGAGFAGIGLIAGDPGFYGYASFNVGAGSFLQAGLGFDI